MKAFLRQNWKKGILLRHCHVEGELVIDIDLDNINEEMVYEAFEVVGNEAEA